MASVNFALAALGALASANHSNTGFPAVQAIDGSDTTYWFASWGGNMPTLTVDLGAPQYIESIDVLPASNGVPSGTWALYYSTDGVNFNFIHGSFPRNARFTFSGINLTARYWRLQYSTWGSDQGGSGIYHFETWGPAEAPPPPTTPVCSYIQAWLDGIEANYVPCVEDWLIDNP